MTEPDELQQVLLSDLPGEVDQRAIEQAGLDLSDGLRLWRALGFPNPKTPRASTRATFGPWGRLLR